MNTIQKLTKEQKEQTLKAQIETYFINREVQTKDIFVHLIKDGGSFAIIDFNAEQPLFKYKLDGLKRFGLELFNINFENNSMQFDLEMEGY